MSRFHAFGHLCASMLWFISFRRTELGHISKHGSLRASSTSCWGGRIPNLNCIRLGQRYVCFHGVSCRHKIKSEESHACVAKTSTFMIMSTRSVLYQHDLFSQGFSRGITKHFNFSLNSNKPPNGVGVLPIICLRCMNKYTLQPHHHLANENSYLTTIINEVWLHQQWNSHVILEESLKERQKCDGQLT